MPIRFQEPKSQSQPPLSSSSPPSRNRGRRRGRNNGRKSDSSDNTLMRPSSRPCTSAYKPTDQNSSKPVETGFPSSSKSLTFAPRPGFGQLGTRCIVKANHFLAELPEKDLNQYDVTITPEVSSKVVNRAIIAELVKIYKESDLGMRLLAYDGRKSLYTAGELPFTRKEFTITLVDQEENTTAPKRKWEYKVVVKYVARANLHHLG